MMPESKRPLKVFLCHADSDHEVVRALCARLTTDAVDVWFDKEDLLPGQDWELEIDRAVREADAVIVCLSRQFNQAGFQQKEVRLALDTAMMQPEGEIFVIPARFEECNNLRSLEKWQLVDLYEDQGYEKLIAALKVRAEKLDRLPIRSSHDEPAIPAEPLRPNLIILPNTRLFVMGEPEEYISEGKTLEFDPADFDFSIERDEPAELEFKMDDGHSSWSLSFAAPRGDALKVGSYEDAERTPFKSFRKPGFEFSGDGRGCNEIRAEFEILKFEHDDWGNLVLFEADFEQFCDDVSASLKGQIRFYAKSV
jgi:hypothetical protein